MSTSATCNPATVLRNSHVGARSALRGARPSCRRTAALPVLATMVGPEKTVGKQTLKKQRATKQQPQPAAPSQNPLIGKQINQGVDFSKLSGKEIEERAMWLQIETAQKYPNGRPELAPKIDPELLEEAYARCGQVTADYAKTFYLGTTLMTPEKAKAIWAIYVWCRRTDELVDGPNSSRITPEVRPRTRSPRDIRRLGVTSTRTMA